MYTLPTLNTLLPSTPTPTTHTHTLSLHDALPIYRARTGLHVHPPRGRDQPRDAEDAERAPRGDAGTSGDPRRHDIPARSEEHTSELQSRRDLVCRLLLENKKTIDTPKQFL